MQCAITLCYNLWWVHVTTSLLCNLVWHALSASYSALHPIIQYKKSPKRAFFATLCKICFVLTKYSMPAHTYYYFRWWLCTNCSLWWVHVTTLSTKSVMHQVQAVAHDMHYVIYRVPKKLPPKWQKKRVFRFPACLEFAMHTRRGDIFPNLILKKSSLVLGILLCPEATPSTGALLFSFFWSHSTLLPVVHDALVTTGDDFPAGTTDFSYSGKIIGVNASLNTTSCNNSVTPQTHYYKTNFQHCKLAHSSRSRIMDCIAHASKQHAFIPLGNNSNATIRGEEVAYEVKRLSLLASVLTKGCLRVYVYPFRCYVN